MSESEPARSARSQGTTDQKTDDLEEACKCSEDTTSSEFVLTDCVCPRDDHGIVIHEKTCLLYKNETIKYTTEPDYCGCPPFETDRCFCCSCPVDQCTCEKPGEQTFDEWRAKRDVGEMPAVLESTHPLMQKFQESLRRFLERENEVAEQEIIALKDELKLQKEAYDRDLEGIYRSDHDTNSQRILIEDYENALANETKARQAAQERERISAEKYNRCKEKLDKDLNLERDSAMELDALTALVAQLEKWREETESDLTVSQRMTEKIRQEKRDLADEKRQLDMIIYGLNNEVWKLESKMEMFKKQMEIKNNEMDKITDKVIAYGTELEDLEMDKKRLMSLWNSVLVNIKKRDFVFDSVRDDYKALQENYRTLVTTLQIAKKTASEAMEKSKELAMERDKLNVDTTAISVLYEAENERREALEAQIQQLHESIEMMDRDQEMITMENLALQNIYESTNKEYERRVQQKLKSENQILENLQDCLLNDKAVEAMAAGIKKMRDMSRKLEISLTNLETKHAKVMLDIEIHRNRQYRNQQNLEKVLAKVAAKEKEFEGLQEKYESTHSIILTKQRELDIVTKRYNTLKEIFDMKSPQERRIEELEKQIRGLRERTETMQHEWLRLQGHVVKLTTQYHKLVADIGLISKQVQICDQKSMQLEAEIEQVRQERLKVDRSLRDLRGRLVMLARARKETSDRNEALQITNIALSHEFSCTLKDAESELINLEEEIENMDREKVILTKDLDHMQREALVWQRKGIQAIELKRSIGEAKSSAGEIGKMRNEIHRMEVRREQLRRTADKLSEDLSLYIMRRESALEKTRASAAMEKARGVGTQTSQFIYKHKLRLARSDVARVTKELEDTKASVKQLEAEQARLQKEVAATSAMNAQLEEHVAQLLRDCTETERNKQWLLERVVRTQRLGGELTTAVKRQSLRIKKPKKAVIEEYTQGRALNDKLRYINEMLMSEYPYMEHKLAVIANTLNIYSPSNSPRLIEDATCDEAEAGQSGCVIPEEVPEHPYPDQNCENALVAYMIADKVEEPCD